MNNGKRAALTLFVLALVLGLASSVRSQGAKLEVEAHPLTLKAGFNTTVTITIFNNFETIYEVSVTVNFPQSQMMAAAPIIIGTNNWRFEKIKEGENVTISPTVFVPGEGAGSGYIANVLISYRRLGYISFSSETHTIGFYAKGYVDVVAYDFVVEPGRATPGSAVTVTATLLNKGNVAAMFTNVSLLPNQILMAGSSSYIGEVEPNSPIPFTLEGVVRPDAKEGNYTVKIKVEYEDEESRVHVFEREATINVVIEKVQQPRETPGSVLLNRIFEFVKGNLLLLIIVIVAIIAIASITAKLRSRGEEF